MIAVKIISLCVLIFNLNVVPLGSCSNYETPKKERQITNASIYEATPLSSNVRWVSVTHASDALLIRPEPAGIENGVHLYLCRAAYNSNRYKPGKLWVNNGRIYCSIGDRSTENHRDAFHMLEAPPGALSWVPVTGRLPSDAIIGGNHANGENAYVCRAWNNGALVVGNLYAGGDGGNDCYVTGGGMEYKIQTNLEVLVVNAYGKAR